MPRYKKKFYGVRIYNFTPMTGVRSDFSMLLKNFIETNSVRYEQFAEVWTDMKMSLIFTGRQNDQEVREFTEECMNIALGYILPPNEFQMQIGGFYLLYALYMKQLFEPKVKIRIGLSQWKHIQTLLKEVQEQKHYDIEYIYWTLQHSNAFQFVAHKSFQSLHGLDNQDGDNQVAATSAEISEDIHNLNQPQSLITELTEGDAIDQLSGIHDQYHRVKCALSGPAAKEPQISLSMIDSTLVQYITKKIANFEWWKKNRAGRRGHRRRHDSGPTTSESEADSETEKSPSSPRRSHSIGKRRSDIKARAMESSSEVSRSRRHRQVKYASDLETDSPATPSRSSVKTKRELTDDDMTASKSDSVSQGVSSPGFSSPGPSDGEHLLHMPALRHLEEVRGNKPKRKYTRRSEKDGKVKHRRKIKPAGEKQNKSKPAGGEKTAGEKQSKSKPAGGENTAGEKQSKSKPAGGENTAGEKQSKSKPAGGEKTAGETLKRPGNNEAEVMDMSPELKKPRKRKQKTPQKARTEQDAETENDFETLGDTSKDNATGNVAGANVDANKISSRGRGRGRGRGTTKGRGIKIKMTGGENIRGPGKSPRPRGRPRKI